MPIETQPTTVEIGLNAAIVAVVNRSPRILAVSESDGDARDSLPFGPFDPALHRTFETSLRDRVEKRTALKLGYIEQLYTFGEVDRDPRDQPPAPDRHDHGIEAGSLVHELGAERGGAEGRAQALEGMDQGAPLLGLQFLDPAEAGVRIDVDCGALDLSDVRVGDSIAVAGCCLTVVGRADTLSGK